METFLYTVLFAGLVGITGFAVKFPSRFEDKILKSLCVGSFSLMFVALAWKLGCDDTFLSVRKYIDPEKTSEAEKAISTISGPTMALVFAITLYLTLGLLIISIIFGKENEKDEKQTKTDDGETVKP